MKKLWHQNRIFIILMTIVIVCFIVMGIFLLKLFFSGNDSKYGDRLEDVESIVVDDKLINKVNKKMMEDTSITTAKANVSGKIIYVTLKFNGISNLSEAQGKAVTAMNEFGEEIGKKYDFQFILLQDATDKSEEIKIMGSKNVSGSGIIWNNNNVLTESGV